MISPRFIRQLRNMSVQELIHALERDGFVCRRAKGSGRVYRHADGRRTVVHYHHSSDTLPIGTLRKVLEGARWTEEDLRRVGLIQ